MRGSDFEGSLIHLIVVDEAARCVRKICSAEHLDLSFFNDVTNAGELMTGKKQDHSLEVSDREIEKGMKAGTITENEAAVMRTFFQTRPEKTWPPTPLQKRMQASGG